MKRRFASLVDGCIRRVTEDFSRRIHIEIQALDLLPELQEAELAQLQDFTRLEMAASTELP